MIFFLENPDDLFFFLAHIKVCYSQKNSILEGEISILLLTSHQKVVITYSTICKRYGNVNFSTSFNLLSVVWRLWDGTLLSWTPLWSQICSHEPYGAEDQNYGLISLGGGEGAGKQWTSACSDPRRYICGRNP